MNLNYVTDFLRKDCERMLADLREEYGSQTFVDQITEEVKIYFDPTATEVIASQAVKLKIQELYGKIRSRIIERGKQFPNRILIIDDCVIENTHETIRYIVKLRSFDITNQRKRILESALIKVAANLLKD